MGKKLVAFFSASGVTRNVAKDLAKTAEADLYEIKPEVPYTNADLDWMDKKSRSTKEMRDKKSRPAIIKGDIDLAEYDIIFLGYPVWWYIAPTILNTFLEAYDFADKRIILFATSGGSGFGKAVEGLIPSVAESATIEEGKILNGHPSIEELKAWVDSLEL